MSSVVVHNLERHSRFVRRFSYKIKVKDQSKLIGFKYLLVLIIARDNLSTWDLHVGVNLVVCIAANAHYFNAYFLKNKNYIIKNN